MPELFIDSALNFLQKIENNQSTCESKNQFYLCVWKRRKNKEMSFLPQQDNPAYMPKIKQEKTNKTKTKSMR